MAARNEVLAASLLLLDDMDDNTCPRLPVLPREFCGALLMPLIREEREKITNYVEVTVPLYLVDDFRRFFRMSRTTFQVILQRISHFPCMQQANVNLHGRPQVSTEKKLLMTLWYIGSQETIKSISDRFDITESAFLRHRTAVVNCVCQLSNSLIHFPTAADQVEQVRKFNEKGFPDAIGAIDGTHIAVKAPADDQSSYFNRKGFTSIILQSICNADMLFTDIYAGWPGKVHDARVFRNSPIFQSGARLCGTHHILGDGAYPIQEWLMTPFRDNGHLSQEQKQYNFLHAKARSVIERAFALLKGRFRRLKYIDMKRMQDVISSVHCSCVLHNICIMDSDEVEDMLSEEPEEEQDQNGYPPVLPNPNANLKRTLIMRQLPRLNN